MTASGSSPVGPPPGDDPEAYIARDRRQALAGKLSPPASTFLPACAAAPSLPTYPGSPSSPNAWATSSAPNVVQRNSPVIWTELEPLRLKGKAERVSASALTSSLSLASKRTVRYELPMVGRVSELKKLNDALESALDNRSRVIGISAEAGLLSRLPLLADVIGI